MKIFISTSSFGKQDSAPINFLRRHGLEPVLNPLGRTLRHEETLLHLDGCTGVIAGTESYNGETFEQLPCLKVISRCGAGIDGIELAAARERGVSVLFTPNSPTQAVAELTVGMILDLLRKITVSTREIKSGIWEKRMGRLVCEMNFGILGLGRIGRKVAALLRAFDAQISGHDVRPDSGWAADIGVTLKDMDAVLRESDVLCLHIPYSDESHHIIDRRELSLMPEGSLLINTSRGGLVDENALCAALKSGHLGGAAIDTFEGEPYKGPLRELDNVILTPHIGSYARAARIAMELEAAENLVKGLRQAGLLNEKETSHG